MKTLFILFFILPIKLLAQYESAPNSNFSLSIGIKNHFPIYYFKRAYSYGFGGELNAEYKISKEIVFVLKPGYLRYFYNQKTTGIAGSTGYFLLLGGVKFYPLKRIYLSGEAGVGIKSSEFGKESAFAYGAGAGYGLAKNFDVELKYLKGNGSTFTPEIIGLNVNYTFYRNRKQGKPGTMR